MMILSLEDSFKLMMQLVMDGSFQLIGTACYSFDEEFLFSGAEDTHTHTHTHKRRTIQICHDECHHLEHHWESLGPKRVSQQTKLERRLDNK